MPTFIATRKTEQNEAWVDPWSAVHLTSGLALGLIGVKFIPSMIAAGVFDVVEHVAESHDLGKRFFNTSGPESAGNIAVDLLLFAAGWKLGEMWNASGQAGGSENEVAPPPESRSRTIVVGVRGCSLDGAAAQSCEVLCEQISSGILANSGEIVIDARHGSQDTVVALLNCLRAAGLEQFAIVVE